MNKDVKPGKGGWALIDCAHSSGTSVVRAQLIGPVAVHRDYVTYIVWRVTHIRTGCAFPIYFPSQQSAARFAGNVRGMMSSLAGEADPLALKPWLKEHKDELVWMAESLGATYEPPSALTATKENYARHFEATP